MKNRNVILIKGYQGKLGRCNVVLEAIKNMKPELSNYEIIIFGANRDVLEYISTSKLDQFINFTVYEKIPHQKVLELMGKAVLYIGNSLSDGMPNTLLEAICMGAFPIQSNPGGATEELIIHGRNGFLIRNPEDSGKIKVLLKKAIEEIQIVTGVKWNLNKVKPTLERELIKSKVIEGYNFIQEVILEQKKQ